MKALKPGETIKIVTHSKGGAYAKSLVEGLVSAAEANGKSREDIIGKIEFEIDLDPYQPEQQRAIEGVPTYVIAHEDDIIAGSKKLPGAHNNPTRRFNIISYDRPDLSKNIFYGYHAPYYGTPEMTVAGVKAHSIKNFTEAEIRKAIIFIRKSK